MHSTSRDADFFWLDKYPFDVIIIKEFLGYFYVYSLFLIFVL
jgi:hypothetical protein